jgi:signal transduction histidine kinase
LPSLRSQSLRTQVIVATCGLLIPFAALELWSENRTLVERQTELQGQASSVAATAATHLNQFLAGVDLLASSLVHHPAVVALDRPECDRLFANLLAQQPLLSNIVVTDVKGMVKGSGLPSNLDTAGRTYIEEVIRTGKPQVTDLIKGPISGKWTVVLAFPVRDTRDQLGGVLTLGLNLVQFDTLFGVIPLPAGSVVTLTDSQSRVLARSLEPERYIGSTIGEIGTPPQAVAQTQVLTGVDGVRRLYGNAVVDRGPWLLSVGIPTRVAVARTQPQWRRSFFIADAAICLGLLMALYMSNRTIRGIDKVHEGVQRIANGDLSPPERSAVPNLELARLQDGFITMAANLRDTHHALDRQIEQERQTREALQSLQRQVVRQERLAAVGVLVSGVAHELNNPLQAILGTAELLERHPDMPSGALDEVAFIKTQSGRAREIIRNLSRFSSQQSGPPALVDVRDVIAEVIQLRQRNLQFGSIVFDVQATTSRKVQANFTELEQVILNFVINAQQSIESGGRSRGRLLIRVFDVGKNVCVEVQDDGPGVKPEDEPKLFQPFFTTKPVGKGTGLGLSVSYGIIESYGGTIGYRSNVWGGATFFFELPAADVEVAYEPTRDATGTDDRAPLLHRPVSPRL